MLKRYEEQPRTLWFEQVESCHFGFEDGVFTARFQGDFNYGDKEIVWTGDDAYISKINWEFFIQREIAESLAIVVEVPSEILQKISDHQAS